MSLSVVSLLKDDGAYRHVTLPIALYLSANTSSQEIIEERSRGVMFASKGYANWIKLVIVSN